MSNRVLELNCRYNNITSLKDFHNYVASLSWYNNTLSSIEGCPSSFLSLKCLGNYPVSIYYAGSNEIIISGGQGLNLFRYL